MGYVKPVYFDWTEERVTELKRLDAEGYSAAQVARKLGGQVTRSAAIAKLHRLGITNPERSKGRQQAQNVPRKLATPKMRVVPPAPVPTARAFQHGKGMDGPHKPVPGQDTAISGPVPDSRNLCILDEGFGGCRWPTLGDGAEMRFCCVPTDGATYCAAHARRAYQGSKVISRDVARDLRRYA